MYHWSIYFHSFPASGGDEQSITLIISLATWLQGCIKGQSVFCSTCVSYTGFVLVAAELSENVLSMGGAYADL